MEFCSLTGVGAGVSRVLGEFVKLRMKTNASWNIPQPTSFLSSSNSLPDRYWFVEASVILWFHIPMVQVKRLDWYHWQILHSLFCLYGLRVSCRKPWRPTRIKINRVTVMESLSNYKPYQHRSDVELLRSCRDTRTCWMLILPVIDREFQILVRQWQILMKPFLVHHKFHVDIENCYFFRSYSTDWSQKKSFRWTRYEQRKTNNLGTGRDKMNTY